MKILLMSVFLIMMLLGFVIIAIGVKITTKNNRKGLALKPIVSGSAMAFFSFILLLLFPAQMFEVNTGEVAVIRRYGSIVRIEEEGLHWKNPFSENYEIYSLQVQEVVVNKECYSKDLQAVKVELVIQFIITGNAEVKNIATTYGSLDILKIRILTLSNEAIEESAKSFDAKELVTKRGEFNSAIKNNIGEKYSVYHISIHQTILSDIQFTAEFEELIQLAKLAEQEIERERQEWEKKLQAAEYQVKIAAEEANERIARAKGEADSAEALALGEAAALKAMADAMAYQIEQLAIAEAEAVRIKLNELNSASPESLIYLEYIAWLETWDGKLPQTILGDNIDILFPAQK